MSATTTHAPNAASNPVAEMFRLDAEWRSTTSELHEAVGIIADLMSKIPQADYLDHAHFTVKRHPESLGALLIVSIPRNVTGGGKQVYASQFVAEQRPFVELMVHHPEMLRGAIESAKGAIRATAH